jgi:hypothetical protein
VVVLVVVVVVVEEVVVVERIEKQRSMSRHTMRRLMTIYVDYDEDAILAILTPKERLELMKDGGLDLRDDMADMERRSSVRALELDDDVIVGEEGCVRKKRKRKMSSSGTNLDTPNRPSKQIGLKATKSTTV